MKNTTIGIFENTDDAERAITQLRKDADVDIGDISFIYRSKHGNTVTEDANTGKKTSMPAKGAAKGAAIGGGIGALAGLATVAGMIPFIGPLFVAGPLAAAIGLTGGVATTAAGAVTGAAAGGIIGALTNLGVGHEEARRYEEDIRSGKVLVAAHSDDPVTVESVMEQNNATDIGTSVVGVETSVEQ